MQSSGINLYFSHSVERLVEVLSERLLQQQSANSLFEPPKVLVPNANMQRFLQLSLATKNGVCAHIDFPFLETGLFQIVKEVSQLNHQHLNGQLLSWLILGVLKSEKITECPNYQPLLGYVSEHDSEALRAAKLWQLSQKLAMLLLDYESQRPEMIDAWLKGKLIFNRSQDTHLVQLEKMQQQLYLDITANSLDCQLSTLYQLGRQLKKTEGKVPHKTIHLFTPSRLSQLHRQLLLQLGQWLPINIYQLNVCIEYWEDMQTSQEIRWQQTQLMKLQQLKIEHRDEAGQLFMPDIVNPELFAELNLPDEDNALLQAWGKPGREALKLYSDIENDALHFCVHYHDHWLLPETKTQQSLLHYVQFNVLQRQPNRKKITDLSQIKSLQILAASSIHREVEAVYNNILWNLQQDDNLLLNDIAVLVTDMNKYRFVIEQVFESLNHQQKTELHYAVVDSSAAIESRYAEGVIGLFKVMEDDFIRATVFNWLANPCVKAACQFDAKDWYDWLMAAEHLGIYAGYEQLYADTDQVEISALFTWKQGLQRLHRTLAVMDEDTEQVSFLDSVSIGQFSVLLETLYQFKQQHQTAKTASQWEQQLNRMFDLLLAIPADESREQFVQMALQQSLQKLAETQPDLILNFKEIKQFVQHELKQIPASKGSYLTGGVVCAALQPMRPIPFKVTYVLGMDEKSFPGQLPKETLDLTNRSRRIGDINAVENKNYLFLETLMCTREKFYLSYVCQDLQKDEVIEPSPVLLTLKAACDDLIDFDCMPINEFPVVQLPLEPRDTFKCFEQHSLYSDWLANYSYTDLLLFCDLYQIDPWPKPVNSRQQQQLQSVQAHIKQSQVPVEPKAADVESEMIHIDASELAEFLLNPQAAVLKKQGVVSQHPEDVSMIDSEPQDISGLLKHQIFTAAVDDWLHNLHTTSFNQLLRQQYEYQLAKSRAPVDLFANLEDFIDLEHKLQELLMPQISAADLIGGVRVGNSKVQQQPGLSLDGIKIQLDDGQQVMVSGLAEQVYAEDNLLCGQVVISSSLKDDVWDSRLAKPFINWCLWQLCEDIKVKQPFRVYRVYPKNVQQVEFKPWTAEGVSFGTQSTIRTYLKKLITAYLHEQSVFLPYDLLTKLKIAKKTIEPKLPFLPQKSKAQSIHYLAYDPADLGSADLKLINEAYQSSIKWPSYEEILGLVDFKLSEHPVADYRHHLLPLFAMVCGHFDVPGGCS